MPDPVRVEPFSMSTLGQEREIADFRPRPVIVGRDAHPANGSQELLFPEDGALRGPENDDLDSLAPGVPEFFEPLEADDDVPVL